VYDHYKGKKVPEARFMTNTVVREFGVSREDAETCVDVFLQNMEFVGVIRVAANGRYLSTDTRAAVPAIRAESSDESAEAVAPDDSAAEPDDVLEDQPLEVEPDVRADEPAVRRVFITHGKQSDPIVKQLKEILGFGDFEPVIAEERETTAKPVPEKVMNDMRSCSAAIIHVSGERKVLDKDGKEHVMLNENVLIEIGAAMALYHDRFILLVENGVQLPSNLQGLYAARYEGTELDQTATMKLLKAFKEFREQS
jgi:predicted nucleotide-binding protein